MKKFLIAMACIFGILTVILYLTSLNHWDGDTAKWLGTDTTINIQGQLFCVACAIICVINIVGAIILSYLETMNENSHPHYNPSNGSTFQSQQTAQPQKTATPLTKEQGLDKHSFLSEIETAESMVEIWNIWRKYNLSAINPSVNDYIRQFKDQEQLHGKTDESLQDIKKTIVESL